MFYTCAISETLIKKSDSHQSKAIQMRNTGGYVSHSLLRLTFLLWLFYWDTGGYVSYYVLRLTSIKSNNNAEYRGVCESLLLF